MCISNVHGFCHVCLQYEKAHFIRILCEIYSSCKWHELMYFGVERKIHIIVLFSLNTESRKAFSTAVTPILNSPLDVKIWMHVLSVFSMFHEGLS